MATFHDIIGQEQIKEHLQNAISAKKISHAYIINGEKSSGKEFIARVFAMTLQCEKGGMEPCQECHSCKQALSDNQPDIIYVSMRSRIPSAWMTSVRRSTMISPSSLTAARIRSIL